MSDIERKARAAGLAGTNAEPREAPTYQSVRREAKFWRDQAEAAEALLAEEVEAHATTLAALNARAEQARTAEASLEQTESARKETERQLQIAEAALQTICDIGETRDVEVARKALDRMTFEGREPLLDTEQGVKADEKEVHNDNSESGEGEARCPDCESDDPGRRGVLPKGGDEGTTRYYCQNPFHSPQPDSDQEGSARKCSCRDDHTSWCEAGCCVVCGEPDCPNKNRCSPHQGCSCRSVEGERIEWNLDPNCPVHGGER